MTQQRPNGLELLRQHYRQRLPLCDKVANWHEFWLLRCLQLAANGLGCVAPNPLVGAILVRPRKIPLRQYMQADLESCPRQVDNQIVFANWQGHFEILGQGYHAAWGQLHAEAAALANAHECGYKPQDFRSAVLYCNLEPCSAGAQKRQPPCCEQIIQEQVGAVVFANSDPTVAGAARLRAAGLPVRCGDLALASAKINQIFFRYMAKCQIASSQEGKLEWLRPWVSLKLAQSLDGCIATKSGNSQWISGPAARAMVQALRAAHGASRSGVTVGRNTLEADNPSLLLRPEFLQQLASSAQLTQQSRKRLLAEQPWRIVWDSSQTSLRCSPPLQFYCGPHTDRSVVIGNALPTNNSGIATIAVGNRLHSGQQGCPPHGQEHSLGLLEGLQALAQPPYSIQHLLLEGGSRLASSFLAMSLVDEVYCFVSQRFIGNGLRSVSEIQPGREEVPLLQTLQLRHSSSMQISEQVYPDWHGPDEVLCHGYLQDIVVPTASTATT